MTTYTYRNIAKTSAYSLCLIALVSSSSLQAISPPDEDIETTYCTTKPLKDSSSKTTKAVGKTLKKYDSLISKDYGGHKRVSNFLKNNQSTLLRWNELSYSLVKGYTPHNDLAVKDMVLLEKEGWKYKAFYGFEGRNNEHADLAGFVAYNKQKSLMTVVFHGTSTVKDKINGKWVTNNKGWTTNFDAKPVKGISFTKNDITYSLPDLPGMKHRGFARKYASSREQIIDLILEYKNGMSPEEIANLRIAFTGHSQGAALGTLAIHDVALNYGKHIFGSGFNNKIHNRLYGYFLSLPRVGDQEFIDSLHEVVGKANVIRQNVHGDPVTVALGRNVVSKKVTWASSKLRELATYKDAGYLLLDTSSDVKKRIRDKGLRIDEVKNQDSVLTNYVYKQINAVKAATNVRTFIDVVSEDVSKTKGFRKITKFFWSSGKEALKRIANCILPAPKAIWDLTANFFIARVAHFHYGHDSADGREAVFNSEIVGSGSDLDVMFERGLRKGNN